VCVSVCACVCVCVCGRLCVCVCGRFVCVRACVCVCLCVNDYVCACVRERFPLVCLSICLSICLCLLCFSSQCKTRRRDGCKMRQSAYTCVNSCLPCPQGTLAAIEPADERAGGRFQRLDQLGVSVSPAPVCAVWRRKTTCACTHMCWKTTCACTHMCLYTYICAMRVLM